MIKNPTIEDIIMVKNNNIKSQGSDQTRAYIILSIVGTCLAFILTYINGITNKTVGFYDKLIIAGLLTVASSIGIIIAIRPEFIRNIHGSIKSSTVGRNIGSVNSKEQNKIMDTKKPTYVKIEGHHPACGCYSTHTFLLGGHHMCVGCISLAIGGLGSIILSFIIALYLSSITFYESLIMIGVGITISWLGFVEYMKKGTIEDSSRAVHATTGFFLPLGYICVSFGLLFSTGEFSAAIAGLAICVLLLDTRVVLSKSMHERICWNCSIDCPRSKVAAKKMNVNDHCGSVLRQSQWCNLDFPKRLNKD